MVQVANSNNKPQSSPLQPKGVICYWILGIIYFLVVVYWLLFTIHSIKAKYL